MNRLSLWSKVNWVAGVYVRKSKPSDVYLVLKTEILTFYRTTCYFLKNSWVQIIDVMFLSKIFIFWKLNWKFCLLFIWAFLSLSTTENIEPCENLYGLRQISLNSGDKPDHTCIKYFSFDGVHNFGWFFLLSFAMKNA